jgi:CheY-specific phosphatase CheX
MKELPAPIRNILISSVCDLFKTNGIANPVEKHDGLMKLEHGDFCAIIGFSGPTIMGNLLLAATHDLLDASHPSKAMGIPVGEEDYADWIGEISNQVIGRLKNALLKYGVNATLTVPTVIKGEHISTFPLKGDTMMEVIHFQLDSFDLLLEAHISVLAPIDFSTIDEANAPEDEGSSMFF